MVGTPALVALAACLAISVSTQTRAAEGETAPLADKKQRHAAPAHRKGAVYRVGPNRELRVPSQAARLVRDGDVVLIDAGVYRDCAVWRANRLVLRGANGIPMSRTSHAKAREFGSSTVTRSESRTCGFRGPKSPIAMARVSGSEVGFWWYATAISTTIKWEF
jgi:hypothetical protein